MNISTGQASGISLEICHYSDPLRLLLEVLPP